MNIPGHGYDKINAAKFYGGHNGGNALLVKTVTEFTGIPVNYYMDVSFVGFKKAVDALGGIWIDVDVKIDDWKAASGSPGHRAQLIEPGYQKLDGEHALTYVRSRAFPDADFTRMKHQQAFFRALAKQMAAPGNFFKIPTVVNSISKYITTTMPVGDIIATAQALQGSIRTRSRPRRSPVSGVRRMCGPTKSGRPSSSTRSLQDGASTQRRPQKPPSRRHRSR